MGYCIEMTDGKFIIKKENFVKALESLKSVFVPENMTCNDYIRVNNFDGGLQTMRMGNG